MDNDREIMSQHLITSKGSNINENVQYKVSSSSESSIDISDPLLEPNNTNQDSKGIVFTPEICDFNPRLSTHEQPALFPPNSVMVQAGGYDPNRIPSSIFASKPTTPMDWSVASNESLFSIHMGNNSFSRDHVFLMYKSGEFPDTNNSQTSLFPVAEGGAVTSLEESMITEEKSVRSAKPETKSPINAGYENRFPRAVPYESKPLKHMMHDKFHHGEEVRNSASSAQSFQFPVLETNLVGNSSVKVVMENVPSKKQMRHEPQLHIHGHGSGPGTPRKPTGGSWFSCFSCCSLGC